MFRVSARTVSNWHDTGLIEGYRIPSPRGEAGNGWRRFELRDVVEFANRNGMPLYGHPRSTLLLTGWTALVEKLASALDGHVRAEPHLFEFASALDRERPYVLILDFGWDAVACREIYGGLRRGRYHNVCLFLVGGEPVQLPDGHDGVFSHSEDSGVRLAEAVKCAWQRLSSTSCARQF